MALPLGVITGINAVVNGFNTVGRVELNRRSDAEPIYASGQAGGADTPLGNIDFTGYIYAWGYKPPSGVFPCFDFNLSFTIQGGQVSGADHAAALVHCTMLEVFVPVHDRSRRHAIFYVVHFGAQGADLTLSDSGAPTPSNIVAKYPVMGLFTALDGTAEANCQSAHLHFMDVSCPPKVNSASNGVYFRPPGNLLWQYTYQRDVNDMTLLPALNSVHEIQSHIQLASGTTVAKWWDLQWGRVTDHHALFGPDEKTVVAYDVRLSKCDQGTSVGVVTDPDGAEMWPIYNG